MEPLLIVPAMLLFVALIISWLVSRARGILNKWAEESGYEVVSAKMCWFLKGPYFWKSSKNQAVFRITVSDSSGDVSTGWACCGGYWLGTFVDRVDVTWDSGERQTSQGHTSERKIAHRVNHAPTPFSLKKPTHWLWRTNFTREQVLQRLKDTEIDDDWLVCPLGHADRAITVGEFASAPDAFAK